MDQVSDIRLADAKRLLSYPPVFRRGIQQLVKPTPNPAAGANFKFPIPGDYWDRILTLAGTFAASAAAGVRSLAVQYQDGDSYIFNQTPLLAQVLPSQTFGFFADLAQNTLLSLAQGTQNEGSVTSPGALAVITSTGISQGGWQINWSVSLNGTVGAADANNFGLFLGSTLVEQSVNAAVVGEYPQTPVDVFATSGGSTYSIKSIGAGTVGAIYGAQISATPIGQFSAQATLPDLVLESGWSVNVVANNIQAGDQFSGMGLLLERYGSKYARGGFYETALGELREYVPDAIELP